MAKVADIEVKVSIEKEVHRGISEVLQEILDEHKLRVSVIAAEWLDVSDASGSKMLLTDLTVTSHSHPGRDV